MALARCLRLAWLLLLGMLCLPGAAQGLQPIPALGARVVDTTNTLAPAQRDALEARLAALERDKGTQIAVLLVPTTQPEDIAAYANRVANAWKIGRRDVGDGLLVLVAKDDRKMRIEVAKALEGAVPDLAARQIIDEAMAPRFRQGDFAGGLDAALTRLQQRIGAENLPAPSAPGAVAAVAQDGVETVGTLIVMILFAGLFIGLFTRLLFGRKFGSLLAGIAAGAFSTQMLEPAWLAVFAGMGAFLLSLLTGGRRAAPAARARGRAKGRRGSSRRDAAWGGFGGGLGGWSSGSSGGSDGGGFSSGGGGDFGGGGASGDW